MLNPSQSFLLVAITAACLSTSDSRAASQLIEKKSKTHWAFQPIADPPLPEVQNSSWALTSLDRFVLAKLEANGLSPSPKADRATLLRRAHLTLTGLPPTYEQVQDFIDDESPDAFARVVDRLLASPQYGERWGRHWLDVARYADTKGYVFQEARQYPYAYTYRDWVIRSLNEDMPYDLFLTYQIAADKIAVAEDQKKHLAAMGFLTVGRRFLNRQPDIIDDRIDVVTRGTMALTVACSRCHDHKYDPIPTADYYSLYGVFASSEEPKQLPLLGEQPVTPETEAFDRELRIREGKVDQYLRKRLNDQRKEKQIKEYLIALKDGDGKNDGELKKLASNRGLVQSFLLRWRNFVNESKKESLNPVFAPWNACFHLPADRFAEEAPKLLTPILENKALNPRVALALKDKKLESIHDLAATYAKLLAHDNQKEPYAKPEREQIGQILYASGTPYDVSLDQLYRELPTPDQELVRKFRRAVEKHKAEHSGAPPRGMVMTDRARPTEPYIFVRGQQGNRGPKVPRQFPAIAAGGTRKPFPKESSGRLEMAQLIASRDNPLTSRVIVNRVWLQHFGSALVATPSDFGLRSDPPSHPQLLDFLAHRFMEEGWSLKKLHRDLLLSASYQQSSAHDPNKAAKDPENKFLWRMNRKRLDFEALRDSLLQAGSQLDLKMFGRPYPDRQEPFRHASHRLQRDRTAEPRKRLPHLRFRQSGRPLSAALRDLRAATGALHDEQPLHANPRPRARGLDGHFSKGGVTRGTGALPLPPDLFSGSRHGGVADRDCLPSRTTNRATNPLYMELRLRFIRGRPGEVQPVTIRQQSLPGWPEDTRPHHWLGEPSQDRRPPRTRPALQGHPALDST